MAPQIVALAFITVANVGLAVVASRAAKSAEVAAASAAELLAEHRSRAVYRPCLVCGAK